MTSRTIDGCIKCGSCVRACPVLAQEGRDRFPGPRRLAVEAPRFVTNLSLLRIPLSMCTTCGRCEEVCPARLPLPAALVRVRALASEGMDRPEGQVRMLENINAAGRTVLPSSPAVTVPTAGDLMFFPGCIAEARLPGTVLAALQLLEAAGARPYIPAGWSCCGSPLEKIGAADHLAMVKERNRALLDGGKVITACPGCTVQLQTAYSMDARHIIEYLYEVGLPREKYDSHARPVKVAMHRPCHLSRVVGSHTMDMARAILEEVPGVTLIDHPGQDDCCGGGGGVASCRPEVAEEMALSKVRSARKAGAEVLLAPCPFCVVNLRRAGGMEVEDLTNFLASRLYPGQNK